jgi:formate hydrogenlyase transcriptional activator
MSDSLRKSYASDEGAALRSIAEGVESETGARFFSSLVRHLATALGCQYSFVTELRPQTQTFRTLAVWGRGRFMDNFEIPLKGTPCENVLCGRFAHYPEHIQERFPEDVGLRRWGVHSYCGVPLLDVSGACVGHLAIFDDKPMHDGPRGINIMRIFAARARAEIERGRMEAALRESEERFRDLYENAPLPIISSTPDGRFVGWNRRFLQWSGYTAEQMATLTTNDFWPASATDQAGIKEVRSRWLNREHFEMEFQVRLAGGRHAWVRGAIRPLFDAAGNVIMSEGILNDITAQRMAQEALRESEDRLARVLDSAMDAIVTFDAARRIELFNEAAEKVLGCKSEEAIGASFDRFLTKGFNTALESSMRTAAAGDQAHPYLFSPGGLTALRASGAEFPLEATLSHVQVAGRSLFILILRDMDERQRAEKELRQLSLQNEYLQEELKETHHQGEIVGRSPTLAAALQKVRLVAPTDSSVLLLGETGTGKELIARAIHSGSARKDKPLIKVNCAALPTGLIESELFGHERGAFTGATEKRIGRFELANGGTIFLDEIGEMPSEVQVKLLRVLQEHEFERVGGHQTIKVDVRVIAATNRDLAGEVGAGRFRGDLYYRLNVFPLRMPPLRERPEDIALLVHFFVQRYAGKIGRKITRIAKDTMERLAAYPWPGNVRELENVIERAVILSEGPDLEIGPELLPAAVNRSPTHSIAAGANAPLGEPERTSADGPATLADMERSHILATLKRTNWRIDGAGGAARMLNLNPSTLRSRIKKLGIRRGNDAI